MGSKIGSRKRKGKGINFDSLDSRKLRSKALAVGQRQRFDQIYGAMIMIMGFLPEIEQLRLQGLDTWWYTIGVGRVQVFLKRQEMFYFALRDKPLIMAVSATGKCEKVEFRGKEKLSENLEWLSCQVGQSRLFQAYKSNYRILKINRWERSFEIERSSRLESRFCCLTNFKDRFAICLGG